MFAEGQARAWLSIGHVLEKSKPEDAVAAYRQAATFAAVKASTDRRSAFDSSCGIATACSAAQQEASRSNAVDFGLQSRMP